MMKISVIVPVFNVEKYLRDCIESVLLQTYKSFELVLVNDGSTDGSGDLCDRYSARNPQQIKVIHKTNGGSLRARLIGMQASVGDVLIFLDADDCLRQDALERIALCFMKNDCDMVLYNTGPCESFPTSQIKQSLEKGAIFEGASKKKLYEKMICGEVSNNIWLKAIKADCARFPQHFMQNTVLYGEDLLLSANFVTNCEKIVYLDEGLYYYRSRPGSAVRIFDVHRNETVKFVHAEFEKYINEWQLSELIPVFNARKVRGWIINLFILVNNRKNMDKAAFKKQMEDMAKDPYFVQAYKSMKRKQLTLNYRVYAFLLKHKWYSVLIAIYLSWGYLKNLGENRAKG